MQFERITLHKKFSLKKYSKKLEKEKLVCVFSMSETIEATSVWGWYNFFLLILAVKLPKNIANQFVFLFFTNPIGQQTLLRYGI